VARAIRILAVAAALAVPAGAGAVNVHRSPDLWATINICDTPQHPDVVGVRGSMPGNGRKGVMYMRFQAQFYAKADGHWHNIKEGADSGFMRVGSSQHSVRESGQNFTFKAPPTGGSYVVRGVVSFQWRTVGKVVRKGGRIVRRKNGRPLRRPGRLLARARKRAQGGHPNTEGADPPNFSRGLCEIR
jgi:hypothetical protein